MTKHYTRAGRGSALFIPDELGYLTRAENRIALGILGQYASEHNRIEKAIQSLEQALRASNLSQTEQTRLESQLHTLKEVRQDLLDTVQQEILVAIRLHRAAK